MGDKTLPMRRAKRRASRRWRPKLDTYTTAWAHLDLSHVPDAKRDSRWGPIPDPNRIVVKGELIPKMHVKVWNGYCPDGDFDKLGTPDWEWEGGSDD